jgi:metallo-beta-lactamase class B
VQVHRPAIWFAILIALGVVTAPVHAQGSRAWTEPFPPFRIADNLYYVGSKGLASYLIKSDDGCILINSSLEESVPLLRDSVEKLGFKFTDVKILLISHAHWDHCAGSARIVQLTGAKYMVMDADEPVIESGGKVDFQYGKSPGSFFPIVAVDRVLHDGDEVALGDTRLVAHLTPGHTKGCTTWTTQVHDGGKTYDAVIVGSPNVNAGYRLVNNDAYPKIAEDFQKTFDTLKKLPCDFFLGAHGDYFSLDEKYSQLEGAAASPFLDRDGYKKFIAEKEQAFRAELEKQKNAN